MSPRDAVEGRIRSAWPHDRLRMRPAEPAVESRPRNKTGEGKGERTYSGPADAAAAAMSGSWVPTGRRSATLRDAWGVGREGSGVNGASCVRRDRMLRSSGEYEEWVASILTSLSCTRIKRPGEGGERRRKLTQG